MADCGKSTELPPPPNRATRNSGSSGGATLTPTGVVPGIYSNATVQVDRFGRLMMAENGAEIERGEQGIQGEKGDTGERGEQGIQGIQGVKGDTGDRGDAGIQGVKGDEGQRGEQGVQGDKGDAGDQGIQGIQGETGLKGDEGQRGEQGVKGDTGDQGIQGIKGDAGIQGEQGVQGVKGDTGLQGIQGDTGEQGIQGVQGDAGIQGVKGDAGVQGDQGVQGIQGERGVQGDQGEEGQRGASLVPDEHGDLTEAKIAEIEALTTDFTYLVNTGGDLRADKTIPATLNGDMSRHIIVWDADPGMWRDYGAFVGVDGPRGLQGEQGIQGVKGDTGSQGVKGDAGIQGIQGERGIQGTQGDPGVRGLQGIQGETGTQGVQGTQGVKGDAGSQGIQGVKGDNGTQGTQGVKGDTGSQGVKGDVGNQGVQGVKGDTGTQGIQGLKGDTGNQGIQGVKGDAGIQGIQGIQGLKGDAGAQGPNGFEWNVRQVTATGTTVGPNDSGFLLSMSGAAAAITVAPLTGSEYIDIANSRAQGQSVTVTQNGVARVIPFGEVWRFFGTSSFFITRRKEHPSFLGAMFTIAATPPVVAIGNNVPIPIPTLVYNTSGYDFKPSGTPANSIVIPAGVEFVKIGIGLSMTAFPAVVNAQMWLDKNGNSSYPGAAVFTGETTFNHSRFSAESSPLKVTTGDIFAFMYSSNSTTTKTPTSQTYLSVEVLDRL